MKTLIHHAYAPFCFIEVEAENVQDLEQVKAVIQQLSQEYPSESAPSVHKIPPEKPEVVKDVVQCGNCNSDNTEPKNTNGNPRMFKHVCKDCEYVAFDNDGVLAWRPYRKKS